MTFNEFLMKYNLTIGELHDDFGIPLRTMYAWKRGQRIPPSYVMRMLDDLYYSKGVIRNGEE